MKPNDLDLDNSNSTEIYRAKASNFLNGLGAYFALVLTTISFLIVLAISFDFQMLEVRQGLLSYLTISSFLLILYGIATTKTADTSIEHRILHIIKRIGDIVVSSAYLFLVAPLFLVLVAAVRIESSGPALYRSTCVGQFGKLFGVIKFRTMYVAPQEGTTLVGRFLRRFSLDEIPILYNVLVGEVSLVGPRPRLPENLAETIDNERKIITVKPGVTGLSQISGASEKQEIDLDLQYIDNWSLLLDIKIAFRTFWILLFNR